VEVRYRELFLRDLRKLKNQPIHDIEEDRITGFRERCLTATTFEDAASTALCQIAGNSAYVSPVHQLIIVAPRIGTRLIPGLNC
jgi:hypothetical protein